LREKESILLLDFNSTKDPYKMRGKGYLKTHSLIRGSPNHQEEKHKQKLNLKHNYNLESELPRDVI